MLVLTRRIGETIVLGDVIELTVAEVRGGKVRLAISAPEAVRIRRAELPVVNVDEASGKSDSPRKLRHAEC